MESAWHCDGVVCIVLPRNRGVWTLVKDAPHELAGRRACPGAVHQTDNDGNSVDVLRVSLEKICKGV